MKNTIVKPPFQNRLVCSNCGCTTSYQPNALNLAAMKVGGVCIAFCDSCELLLNTEGSVVAVAFGSLPVQFPFVTGYPHQS